MTNHRICSNIANSNPKESEIRCPLNNIVSTPTHERCVTSYAARTQYKPGVVHPPHIKVKDAIDIHCHTHEGQQDPYDLARRASLAEMKGLLFKSIPGDDPVKATQDVQDDVNRWAEKEGVTPITCWSSYVCGRQMAPISAKTVSAMIDRGIAAVWLPVFTHVITMSTVGTYGRFVQSRNTPGLDRARCRGMKPCRSATTISTRTAS